MPKVYIQLSDIDAAIFDMDGTMIDNGAYHRKAWQEYMKRHGVPLTDDEFRDKIAGRKNDQILASIFDRQLDAEEIVSFAEEKEALYRDLYKQDIKEVSGLAALITELHQRNVKPAIATTANRKNREFALKALGLEGQFAVIVGDEHVTQGKPHPEIYLQTASRLKVTPAKCIVFEDTPSGIRAGKEAGMTVIGLLTSHPPSSLADADYLVHDFTEIELL